MSLSLWPGTLDTRVAYVQVKLTHLLMPSDGSSDELNEILMDAEALGQCYYRNDEHEPPALFRDEPALLLAWQNGYDGAAEWAEMADCSFCNDDSGNPCPCHG